MSDIADNIATVERERIAAAAAIRSGPKRIRKTSRWSQSPKSSLLRRGH